MELSKKDNFHDDLCSPSDLVNQRNYHQLQASQCAHITAILSLCTAGLVATSANQLLNGNLSIGLVSALGAGTFALMSKESYSDLSGEIKEAKKYQGYLDKMLDEQ